MTTVIMRKYDDGKWAVTVERYGYHHTHTKVTPSSIGRMSKVCAGKNKMLTRKYDHITTTIKL